jgi:hypothetical protein
MAMPITIAIRFSASSACLVKDTMNLTLSASQNDRGEHQARSLACTEPLVVASG